MAYYISHKKIRLLDGTIIEQDENGNFPPLGDVVDIDRACDICPVRKFCGDNNEFKCQVYGMFEGFYFSLDDALVDYMPQKEIT